MGATFVVTLREGFEAALLLGIVYTCLDKLSARQQYRWVTLGGVLGTVASVLMGVTIMQISGPLLDVGPDLIGAGVVFVAVAVLTWHGWWMRWHARTIGDEVQRRVLEAHMRRRLWVVGLIAFTGVFREGAETVLFLWGLLSQATTDAATWSGAAGAVLGLATAAALGWAVFRGGRRLSLPRFFAVTSIVLLLVAAGLVATGVGRLQGLGLLPQTRAIWDTSALLDDSSTIGGFVNGLIGYRARPTTAEATGYAIYLLGAGLLFFRRPASERIQAGDRLPAGERVE